MSVCFCEQTQPVAADQRAALLAALREWESWLEAREAAEPPGFIIYRPAGAPRRTALPLQQLGTRKLPRDVVVSCSARLRPLACTDPAVRHGARCCSGLRRKDEMAQCL